MEELFLALLWWVFVTVKTSQLFPSYLKMEYLGSDRAANENEILAWHFRPEGAPPHAWTVTVYND